MVVDEDAAHLGGRATVLSQAWCCWLHWEPFMGTHSSYFSTVHISTPFTQIGRRPVTPARGSMSRSDLSFATYIVLKGYPPRRDGDYAPQRQRTELKLISHARWQRPAGPGIHPASYRLILPLSSQGCVLLARRLVWALTDELQPAPALAATPGRLAPSGAKDTTLWA